MSTEPIPTWAREMAVQLRVQCEVAWLALGFTSTSNASDAVVNATNEVVARALVEQRSIGDRAGWSRAIAAVVPSDERDYKYCAYDSGPTGDGP